MDSFLKSVFIQHRMAKMAVGGQAVIDGVMMKSPHYYAVSVRREDGTISTESWRFKSIAEKYKIFKAPFLRGIVSMFEMLKLGMKALTHSANEATGEEEDLSDWAMFTTVAFSMLLAVGIFVFLPYLMTNLLGISEENNTILFNAVDGIIKILFFVAYVYAISFMDDIKNVFRYHGAEHMAVHCFEAKKELTIKNVKKYGTFHPRCGTSFIVIVLVVMILVFSFIPHLMKLLFPAIETLTPLAKRMLFFGVRILFIIPVTGISYEVLKLSFKFKDGVFMKIMSYPGRLVQSMTAKQPSDDQIEIAVKSLKEVLRKEEKFKQKA